MREQEQKRLKGKSTSKLGLGKRAGSWERPKKGEGAGEINCEKKSKSSRCGFLSSSISVQGGRSAKGHVSEMNHRKREERGGLITKDGTIGEERVQERGRLLHNGKEREAGKKS